MISTANDSSGMDDTHLKSEHSEGIAQRKPAEVT